MTEPDPDLRQILGAALAAFEARSHVTSPPTAAAKMSPFCFLDTGRECNSAFRVRNKIENRVDRYTTSRQPLVTRRLAHEIYAGQPMCRSRLSLSCLPIGIPIGDDGGTDTKRAGHSPATNASVAIASPTLRA